MDRDERGRAGGVDGDRRALEAEGVGDAAGDDAGRRPGNDRRAGRRRHCDQVGIVTPRGTGKDPRSRTSQRARVNARAFAGLPGNFQQQPLLGVDRQRLSRAYPEESRVEVGDGWQKSAFAHVGRAPVVGVWVEKPCEVPAAIGGELGDRIAARRDQIPQVLRRPNVSGIATADPDDGDRLGGAPFEPRRPPFRLAQIDGDLLQVAAQLRLVAHSPTSSATPSSSSIRANTSSCDIAARSSVVISSSSSSSSSASSASAAAAVGAIVATR